MKEKQELLDFKLDWDLGTPEVATFSVILAVAFGLPLMLSRQELLSISSVVFYILLFIIGFFGHIDDVTREGFEKIKKDQVFKAIGLGLVGFLIIQALFFIGLTLLATSENSVVMNKWELLIFNLTFVIAAEELVFRDSLPFIISMALGRAMNEYLAVAVAFVVSSVAFGTLHIWTYGFDSLAVLKAIISGLILSVIRIFGGLLASYIAHLTYNSLNILGLFILPF